MTEKEIYLGLYPHWLDGEYFLTSTRKIDEAFRAESLENVVRTVKLEAIMGRSLLLSDVQVFDSLAILRLFDHAPFLAFLHECPGFLHLAVTQDDISSRISTFEKATTGLHRVLNPNWTSSTLVDTTPIRRLAYSILSLGEIDYDMLVSSDSRGLKTIIDEAGAQRYLLEGAIRSLSYFASTENQAYVHLRERKPENNMYQKLQELRCRPGLSSNHALKLEDTLKYIDENIEDPQGKAQRSVLFGLLEKDLSNKNVSNERFRTIRNTAVHAWNTAVEHNLAPPCKDNRESLSGGGSSGYLPDSVAVGPLLTDPAEMILSIQHLRSYFKEGKPLLTPIAMFNIDPLDLPWHTVSRIVTKTRNNTMAELQEALKHRYDESKDERESKITNAAFKHCSNIATVLKEEEFPFPRVPKELNLFWIFGGVAAVYFGYPVSGLMPAVAAAGATWTAFQYILAHLNKYVMVNTLSDLIIEQSERQQNNRFLS